MEEEAEEEWHLTTFRASMSLITDGGDAMLDILADIWDCPTNSPVAHILLLLCV